MDLNNHRVNEFVISTGDYGGVRGRPVCVRDVDSVIPVRSDVRNRRLYVAEMLPAISRLLENLPDWFTRPRARPPAAPARPCPQPRRCSNFAYCEPKHLPAINLFLLKVYQRYGDLLEKS